LAYCQNIAHHTRKTFSILFLAGDESPDRLLVGT